MFSHFTLAHIPTLLVATATTFGGLMPFVNAEYAIEEFGLPKRIAASKEAQAVMVLSSARTTVVGAIIFVLYFQQKFSDVDMVLLLLGAYIGAVDGFVCWREGVPNKAVFRAGSGAAIAAWGWFGMTAEA